MCSNQIYNFSILKRYMLTKGGSYYSNYSTLYKNAEYTSGGGTSFCASIIKIMY